MGAPVDLIKRLINAGVSDEDIQAINDAWSAPVPELDPRAGKKAYDRAYQASKRERDRTTSHDIVKHCDVFLSKSSLEEESKKDHSTKTTSSRGRRLPEDWQPSQETITWAASEYGLSDTDGQCLLDEFHDYWHSVPGARGTKLDWDKTFKNRIRDKMVKGKINGHGTNLQLTDAERQERFREALRTGKAY